jgi:hypothetical protein
MNEILNHPLVQGGVAPFVAALIVALVLGRVRLGGLAVLAGFFAAVYLVSGIDFIPLTAARKIVLLVAAGAVIGLLMDFAFKPTRLGIVLLALAGGAAALWAFLPALSQKETAQATQLGGVAALLAVWLAGFGLSALSEHPLRAGAAGLGLGIAAGGCALLGASAVYGSYGIALAAAAGAFLLPQMLSGKATPAGATFVLPITLGTALIAAGAAILAQTPWYLPPLLGLIPVVARLPAPQKPWAQAMTASAYCLAVAALALALAWQASRGTPG